MKQLILLLLLALYASAETPEDWFADYSAHEENSVQRRATYVETHLPGDTTYRKLAEQTLGGQMPLLRYLLRYYLTNDPDRLQWDKFGPFLQVLPCDCGEEGSIDSESFRVLFPAYSRASRAWDKIDPRLDKKYLELGYAMRDDEKLRAANETELADLKVRFERIKAEFKRRRGANQTLVPTVMSVTPAADAPVAPATTAAHL